MPRDKQSAMSGCVVGFTLTGLVLGIGCGLIGFVGSALRTGKEVEVLTSPNSTSPVQTPNNQPVQVRRAKMSAEVIETIVERFTNDTGLQSWVILPTWKNTGEDAIKKVYASITVIGSNGEVIERLSFKRYGIFVVRNSAVGVIPGEVYKSDALKNGYLIPLSELPQKPTAIVSIVEVSGDGFSAD